MHRSAWVSGLILVVLISVLTLHNPETALAHRKPKIHILTPHPGQRDAPVSNQETVYASESANPTIPEGLFEKRGNVVAGIFYAQIWKTKPKGHFDCTIDVVVANQDPEKELVVRQRYFIARDDQTGRYWALASEQDERDVILRVAGEAPAPYVPPPPPPSYTVYNSDGSTSTATPQPDGISQAGQAIANAIERRQFRKYQGAELKRLDSHFHDALLQPQQSMGGWLTIHGITLEHPLRLTLYVGDERFVFIFGPEVQEY